MFRFLFVVFVVVPLLEVYLLLQVGGVIGALPTIGLVVLTAVIGAALIRIQGLLTISRFQEKLQAGQMPAEELLTGMALLVAGAFLMTPGFFTDTAGFLLLVPAFRRYLFRILIANNILKMHGGGNVPPSGPVTIEGESTRVD